MAKKQTSERQRELGARIAASREARGLSQKQLADLVGCTPQLMSKYENGHDNPSAPRLLKISNILQCDYEQLRYGPAGSQAQRLAKLTIREQLVALGVQYDLLLDRLGLAEHRLAIADNIETQRLNGDIGLSWQNIRVETVAEPPLFPTPVNIWCASHPIRQPNWPYGFLVGWKEPIVDDGSILTLRFALGDWHKVEGITACEYPIRDELDRGVLRLPKLPSYMGVSCLIVSRDNRVLLGLRPDNVRHEAGQWMAGVGETMRWDEDNLPATGLHPINTVYRALQEEVGLPRDVAEKAKVTFLYMAISVVNFSTTLFAHVSVPMDMSDILTCVPVDNELALKTSIPFELDTALSLVVEGRYLSNTATREYAPMTSWGRLGLLYACMHTFSSDRVRKTLATLA